MGLMIITTVLSFFFSALLLVLPFASLQIHHSQPSLEHQVNRHKLMISPPTLPRKLISTGQIKEQQARNFAADKKAKESRSGKQTMVVGRRGRQQEREESDDPSEYFTKDYSRATKRRPVHNKHLIKH